MQILNEMNTHPEVAERPPKSIVQNVYLKRSQGLIKALFSLIFFIVKAFSDFLLYLVLQYYCLSLLCKPVSCLVPKAEFVSGVSLQ